MSAAASEVIDWKSDAEIRAELPRLFPSKSSAERIGREYRDELAEAGAAIIWRGRRLWNPQAFAAWFDKRFGPQGR